MANKQKEWRTRAAGLKRLAIKRGTHQRGARYGKLSRDTHVRILPPAPTLFYVPAIRAGIFKEPT